jgi:CHAT domain
MATSSLTLTLTPKGRSDRFTLTGEMITYSIKFQAEDEVVLRDLLKRLQQILTGSFESEEQLAPTSLMQEIGTRLWQVLMPNTATLKSRLAMERKLYNGSTHLRIVTPHNLTLLPWELLYNTQSPSSAGFLAHKRPIVRLIPGSNNLPPLSPPLRVLLLISSPLDIDEQRRIDIERKRIAVENATLEFREEGLLHLKIVTPRFAHQALLNFEPHILHYIGLGSYEKSNGGFLIWENDHGKPLRVRASLLADWLRTRKLRAVLLQSSKMTNDNRYSNLWNVSNALIEAGIPAVLTLQTNFTDESILDTCKVLYTVLARLKEGLAEASFEVRMSLALANCNDWALLTLQATEGGLEPLFDKEAPPGSPDPALAPNRVADLLQPDSFDLGDKGVIVPYGSGKAINLKGGEKEVQFPQSSYGVFQSGYVQPISIQANKVVIDNSQGPGKDVIMGDQFNMSGNFQGAILNIKSRLENVTQSIGDLPETDKTTKDELEELVTQLSEILKQVPPERIEDAEKISKRLDAAVEEAKDSKPDKDVIKSNLNSFLETAKNISAVLPTVLPIAAAIVGHISNLIH